MAYELRHSELVEARRLLGKAVPHIDAPHLAEALARGLGFTCHDALLDAASAGAVVRVSPDRPAFESFLAAQGYAPNKLQIALLPDAIRLATGVAWRLPPRPNGTGLERCTHCRDEFWSEGPHNLICRDCKLRNGSVPGVHHASDLCDQMVYDAFYFGVVFDYAGSRLRGRPGWADMLDGPDLRARVEQWRGYRKAVHAHDWAALPDGQRFLIRWFGEASYLRMFKWERPVQRRAA
ncbi:MAG: hypothetical protein ACJ8AW_21705 [Rhodopila sp.]